MDGEHVGFLQGARIDALMRGDRRKRCQPVAIDRGALEIERGRRTSISAAISFCTIRLRPERNSLASLTNSL